MIGSRVTSMRINGRRKKTQCALRWRTLHYNRNGRFLSDIVVIRLVSRTKESTSCVKATQVMRRRAVDVSFSAAQRRKNHSSHNKRERHTRAHTQAHTHTATISMCWTHVKLISLWSICEYCTPTARHITLCIVHKIDRFVTLKNTHNWISSSIRFRNELPTREIISSRLKFYIIELYCQFITHSNEFWHCCKNAIELLT